MSKSDTQTLSGLGLSPEQIVSRTRQAITDKLSKNVTNKSNFLARLIKWRLEFLEKHFFSTDDCIIGLMYWLLSTFLLAAVIHNCIFYNTSLLLASIILYVGAMLMSTFTLLCHGKYAHKHLLHHLIGPMMPLVNLADFVIILIWDSGCIGNTDSNREAYDLKYQLANLNPAETVVNYYLGILSHAKDEMLGLKSDLHVAEEALREKLRKRRTDLERVKARLSQLTDKETDRRQQLTKLSSVVEKSIEHLGDALAKTQTITAKTDAFFKECENEVRGLRGPLEDDLLLKEIHADLDADDDLLAQTELAVTNSISRIRDRFMNFATVISLPQINGDDEDMVQTLNRIDRIAEHMAEIETQSFTT